MDTESTPEDSKERTQSDSPDYKQPASGEYELEAACGTNVYACRHGVCIHTRPWQGTEYCTPIYNDRLRRGRG